MHAAWSRFAFTAGLLLAAVPGIGSAQGHGTAESRELLTPLGAYVLFGGGVTDFTKSAVRDRFDVGGTWDLRVGIGSRSYVGAEAAYVGSALNAIGSGSDLVANGAEGVLRLQYPYAAGSWLVEPFAFGGIGWSHLSLRDAGPGLKDSDDVGVVPFGGGLTVGYERLMFDARFTYRTRFDEDLALGVNESPADLEQWAVSASIGYQF
jgi:hypothetical protein